MKTQLIKMDFVDGLKVTIIPDQTNDYWMSSTDVAKGFGVPVSTLRAQFRRNKSEFKEGKHFAGGISIRTALEPGEQKLIKQPHQKYYSRNGIVRMGFFIKSGRAKQFRDWAEDLIVNILERKLPALPAAPKRKHNRMTIERVNTMLCDIIRVKDEEVRMRLMNTLMDY